MLQYVLDFTVITTLDCCFHYLHDGQGQ